MNLVFYPGSRIILCVVGLFLQPTAATALETDIKSKRLFGPCKCDRFTQSLLYASGENCDVKIPTQLTESLIDRLSRPHHNEGLKTSAHKGHTIATVAPQ